MDETKISDGSATAEANGGKGTAEANGGGGTAEANGGGGTQPPARAQVRSPRGSHDEAAALTPRELSVLRLAAEGHSDREIGSLLHLSESTVKTHLRNTYAKLGVFGRTAAVARTLRAGVIE